MLHEFSERDLALFLVRFSLTFVMGGAVFLPVLLRVRPGQLWERCKAHKGALLLLLMAVAVISQPVLAGPKISEKDIQRLAGVALGPGLLGCAVIAPVVLEKRRLLVVAALLFLGSLHHLFSFYGPAEHLKAAFAGAHVVLALAIAVLVWRAQCVNETATALEIDVDSA